VKGGVIMNINESRQNTIFGYESPARADRFESAARRAWNNRTDSGADSSIRVIRESIGGETTTSKKPNVQHKPKADEYGMPYVTLPINEPIRVSPKVAISEIDINI
jgi:hypothetical protein